MTKVLIRRGFQDTDSIEDDHARTQAEDTICKPWRAAQEEPSPKHIDLRHQPPGWERDSVWSSPYPAMQPQRPGLLQLCLPALRPGGLAASLQKPPTSTPQGITNWGLLFLKVPSCGERGLKCR